MHGLKFMQLSLRCRVTCAFTGCNTDVGEHHCTRVITLPGFLQSARPPSSLSRTCRRPRIVRFLAFCALDNLCNLCNGLASKAWITAWTNPYHIEYASGAPALLGTFLAEVPRLRKGGEPPDQGCHVGSASLWRSWRLPT